MEEKLKLAGRAWRRLYLFTGIFCAFARDMGMDETLGYKIMEGFGGGSAACGDVRRVCAAAAVISYCTSSASIDGASREKTGRAIRRAAEIYWREYGAIRCREIPHGSAPSLPVRRESQGRRANRAQGALRGRARNDAAGMREL